MIVGFDRWCGDGCRGVAQPQVVTGTREHPTPFRSESLASYQPTRDSQSLSASLCASQSSNSNLGRGPWIWGIPWDGRDRCTLPGADGVEVSGSQK